MALKIEKTSLFPTDYFSFKEENLPLGQAREAHFAQMENAWKSLERSVIRLSKQTLFAPEIITATSSEKLEKKFVQKYGYPAALIEDSASDRLLLQTKNGAYWEYPLAENNFLIRRMSQEEGEALLIEEANSELAHLNFLFETRPQLRQAIKSTSYDENSSKAQKRDPYFFDSKPYTFLNPNAQIAYAEDTRPPYYFSQPLNSCVAAGILNGALLTGTLTTPDMNLLSQFQRKLQSMQSSTSGRIDAIRLLSDVGAGRIPGLEGHTITAQDLAETLANHKPVLAIVPYFAAHAMAVISVSPQNDTYRAIDTVSGMEVQLSFSGVLTREHEDESLDLDNNNSENNIRKLAEAKRSGEKIVKFLLGHNFYRINGGGYSSQPFFISFQITDREQFLNWVQNLAN